MTVNEKLDINKVRNDFPILNSSVFNKPLIYFDNGATTQKPLRVIQKIEELYTLKNSSIHRGVHQLSERMTEEYENARETVRQFINARDTSEIIFTSGTTGSINALAFSFGEKYINEGDEIIISEMEHHSNIVPWQMMCARKNAKLQIIPFNDKGELELKKLEDLISEHTKLVSVVQVSNSLGTVNPVKEIIRIAHSHGIPVMIDGAQAVQHAKVDMQELDADFYAFSGHKIFGPTGIGVLYGKEKFLDEMPPYQGGGDMVDCVSFEKTTYNTLPFKYEAGTMNYIGAVGMAEALRYIQDIGIENIQAAEKDLLAYGTKRLNEIESIEIFGHASDKISIFSFLAGNTHPYDIGMILDKMGIAVRTGTHCTQPVMDHFKISGTLRASLVFYNTREEIDQFIEGLKKAIQMLS